MRRRATERTTSGPFTGLKAVIQKNYAKGHEATYAVQQIGLLLDDLVGEREQFARHLEEPSAFAVLKLSASTNLVGCNTGKLGWLLAFENATDIHACLPKHLQLIGAIAHQATGRDERPECSNLQTDAASGFPDTLNVLARG